MGKLLTIDEILAAVDIQTEEIEVPEWGGTIRLQEMTAERRLAFEKSIRDEDTLLMIQLKALAWSAVNEAGEVSWTEEQVQALRKKNFRVIARLGAAALRLNSIHKAAVAEAVENFTATQGDGLPSS